MRVFVTGASGWIGSAAVEELLSAGHEVIGLARSRKSAESIAGKGATALPGDLDDLDALRRGARESEAVVHLANKHDWADPAESDRAERAAVQAMLTELEATGRPFLIANGISGLTDGRPALESHPHRPGGGPGAPGAGTVADDRRTPGPAGGATGGAHQRTASAGARGRRQGRRPAPAGAARRAADRARSGHHAERTGPHRARHPRRPRRRRDAAELSRVLRNVIDNALRYARTTVRVTAREAGDTVRVTVADDGPGIPTEERERVFDRFVRLDAGRTHGAGSTGLGLAIAKAIVAAHGGSIAIDTAPEGGALVVITLRGFGETSIVH